MSDTSDTNSETNSCYSAEELSDDEIEQFNNKITKKKELIKKSLNKDNENNVHITKHNQNKHDILWCDKYRPKKISDICGNKANLEIISTWLDNFKNKVEGTENALFLAGPPGIGKTTMAHLVLLEFGYEVIEYNASDVRSQKSVKENLNKILNSSNISMIQHNEHKNMGIIMDEVDGMSSGDRGGVAELVSLINPTKVKKKISNNKKTAVKTSIKIINKKSKVKTEKINNIEKIDFYINPIICICNNNNDKKLADLKKNCLDIIFVKPSINDLLIFARKIVKNENMNIDDNALELISEHSQGDFRRIGYILQDIHNTYKGQHVSYTEVNSLKEIFLKKNIDTNSFSATDAILSNYKNIQHTLSLFESDRKMISMNVHENFIDRIFETGYNIETLHRNMYNIFHYISIGDIIDKYIYNHQCWNLQDFNGIIKCAYPSYLINKSKKNKSQQQHNNPIKFTTIMSKSASQSANFKYTINSKNKLKIDKQYLPYMTDIFLSNIMPKDMNNIPITCEETNKEINRKKMLCIMKSCDMNAIDFDKFAKINLFYVNCKKTLTEKMKTIITNELNNN
jgi:replication factor C subunit 1